MIVKEIIGKHRNGENLIKNYSDQNLFIRKIATNEIYEEAIDLESKEYDYEETDVPVPIMEDITEFEQWKI